MEKRNSLRSVRETGAALSRGRGTGGAVADLTDTLSVSLRGDERKHRGRRGEKGENTELSKSVSFSVVSLSSVGKRV
jgi:hypothetical protein